MDPELGEVAPVEEVVAPVETLEPEVTPREEPAVPATMEDTIRAKFRELNTPVPAADAPVPEGQMRGPDGRFVPKPKEAVKPVAKASGTPADASVTPAAAVAKPGDAAVVKPAVVPADIAKAPTSWKAGAQAKYEALDPEVKAMVHQREADFHKGIEQYRGLAALGQTFHNEFQPYEAMIRAAGITPQALVKSWMNAEYQLKIGTPEQKAALFVKYAKDYGIDLAHVTAAAEKIAAGQPAVAPVDPQIAALQQKLDAVTGHIENTKKETAQREYAGIVNEVTEFGNKPENKHFAAVKDHMAALMQTGQASSLQDAYDKAIWANTDVRTLLLSEQAEAAKVKAAERAAAARKAAGANVATRGTLPAAPAKAVNGTMEDTIRTNLRAIQARSGT